MPSVDNFTSVPDSQSVVELIQAIYAEPIGKSDRVPASTTQADKVLPGCTVDSGAAHAVQSPPHDSSYSISFKELLSAGSCDASEQPWYSSFASEVPLRSGTAHGDRSEVKGAGEVGDKKVEHRLEAREETKERKEWELIKKLVKDGKIPSEVTQSLEAGNVSFRTLGGLNIESLNKKLSSIDWQLILIPSEDGLTLVLKDAANAKILSSVKADSKEAKAKGAQLVEWIAEIGTPQSSRITARDALIMSGLRMTGSLLLPRPEKASR
ncbi:MAG: hypothetical protein K2Z81_20270 [Cyanobacteria bacterium]|nr:hypothetical protein [Cyanobacteriota bacterium]